MVDRLLGQRREDCGRAKLYSLHAPELGCIGKDRARARFKFGARVSIATPNAAAPGGRFVVGPRALPGNTYDGRTLTAEIGETDRITGVAVEGAYVDRGSRGHNGARHRVFISRLKRGMTPAIGRERRHRNAVEPLIGHMKYDGHLNRDSLLSPDGDAINAALAATGRHLRLPPRAADAHYCHPVRRNAGWAQTAISSPDEPRRRKQTFFTDD